MVYGWPLTLLKWIWEGFGLGIVPTTVIFYSLRIVMFMFSFVLEDWALHELLHVPKERRIATILVASSYVTGTYQTHTFSNSAETLLVLWCLVLVQRIKEAEVSSSAIFTGLSNIVHRRVLEKSHQSFWHSLEFLVPLIASHFQRFL